MWKKILGLLSLSAVFVCLSLPAPSFAKEPAPDAAAGQRAKTKHHKKHHHVRHAHKAKSRHHARAKQHAKAQHKAHSNAQVLDVQSDMEQNIQ